MSDIMASKFLGLILRHQPDAAGVELDGAGWVDVGALLAGMARKGAVLSRDDLARIVETSDKGRFAFDDSGKRIRAVQGHSFAVDLGYPPAAPPPLLYHGTVARFLPAIRETGLLPGKRQYVHLSPDRETAETGGRRRGPAVILTIDSAAMARHGHDFFEADNGVWLTENVPPEYITAWA